MRPGLRDEVFERLYADLQSAEDTLERCIRQQRTATDPAANWLRIQELQRTVSHRYGAVREYLRLLRTGVQEI